MTCDFCETELPARVLICPCGRLAYGKRVATLARQADELEAQGAKAEAKAAWLSALELLPETSGQARDIKGRIERLGDVGPGAASHAGAKKAVGVLAAVGLFLAKFKSVLVFAAKGSKLVALFLGMAVSIWFYALIFKLPFVIGLIGLFWIHEMGHVAAMAAFGMRIDGVYFFPFRGAFARSRAVHLNAAERAWVGLAGPFLGAVGGAILIGFSYLLSDSSAELPLVLGQFAIFMNLIQLIPWSVLDGGAVAETLTPALWAVGTAVVGIVGFALGEPYIVLLALLPMATIFQIARERKQGGALARYHDVSLGMRLLVSVAYVALIAVLLFAELETRENADALLLRYGRTRSF